MARRGAHLRARKEEDAPNQVLAAPVGEAAGEQHREAGGEHPAGADQRAPADLLRHPKHLAPGLGPLGIDVRQRHLGRAKDDRGRDQRPEQGGERDAPEVPNFSAKM